MLVVDDDAAARDHLTRRLRRRGIEATAVANGEDALQRIAEDGAGIDLVLLDIMMPDIDGMQVLRSVREQYAPIDLPVVMVTAKSDSQDVVEALSAGANDYITKPVEMRVAFARLQNHLKLKELHDALRASQERYALAARSVSEGLWDWDLAGNRIEFSERWKSMLGLDDDTVGDDPEEWLGRVHPDDRPRLEEAIRVHLDGITDTLQSEYRIRDANGAYHWVVCTGLVAADETGAPVRLVGSQTDVARIRTRDPLTGLPNRLMLGERIEHAIERAHRSPGRDFAILFFDLDGFKEVNDTFGHAAGDRLLQAVAQRLSDSVRAQDLIARVGGDEFVVLAEDVGGIDEITVVAERLLAVFDTPVAFEEKEAMVGASVGISRHPRDGTMPAELINRADTAMYHAKKRAGKRYEFYTDEITRVEAERAEMEAALHKASERDELALWYAPLIRLDSGEIHGVCAQPAWEHPDYGAVTGDELMALVKDGPLGTALGWRLFQIACHDLRRWQDADTPIGRVVMPLSEPDVRSGEPSKYVPRLVTESGIDPRPLTVVLPGDFVLSAQAGLDATVLTQGLHQLGLGLAVDQFGGSAISLASLRTLTLDMVQLADELVREVAGDDTAARLIEAVVEAARAHDLDTYARGVSTQAQRERLVQAGCTYASGPLFGEPGRHGDWYRGG